MKKHLLLLVALLMSLGANADVEINETNFPDENFRKFLRAQYGCGDVIADEAISKIKSLNCSCKQISSLVGIGFFTALTYLKCDGNPLVALDLSKNEALTYLDCYGCLLNGINLSRNKALTFLQCSYNKLNSLDVQNNTKLENLSCGNNVLHSLDVSENTALKSLICLDNHLTSLDVSKNTALTELLCNNNQLTSLDVSKNIALKRLDCDDNQLTSLDVSKNTALTFLDCCMNNIKGEGMVKLVYGLPQQRSAQLFICDSQGEDGNVCTTVHVDIAKQKGWEVYCWLGIGYHPSIYSGSVPPGIIISETNFPDANFRKFLLEQSYGNDGGITDDEISNIEKINLSYRTISSLDGIAFFTALTHLECDCNQLTSLDVSKNTALTDLRCSLNQLTSLDVSKNIALEKLYCDNNQLTSLDVSNNTCLNYLKCSDNLLTSLDVSKNTALTGLLCHNDQLTSLDVSKNTALTSLNCINNQLTSIDVSRNTRFKYFYCANNQLSSLDVSKNTALKILYCDNNQLTSLDVSKNAALTRLDCYMNNIKGENMDVLVNGLPQQGSAQLYIYDSRGEDGNVCTTEHVSIAKQKGWRVLYSDRKDSWVDYSGTDPSSLERISIDENEIANVFTLDGQQMNSMHKGLNIIRMKDGSTRKVMMK